MSKSGETARLDIWLWRARFFKTRALSGKQVSKRGVRITRNGDTRRVKKPATSIAPGDVLTFSRGQQIVVIEVAGLGERRGPANEAQSLYHDVGESHA